MAPFRLGELFCGPGGLAQGAFSAVSDDGALSVVHAWASDIDADSCATYVKNLCPERPESVVCCDVRQLDLASLPPIDAFAFGFPCNSFSKVGEHRGRRDSRFGSLYKYGVEALRIFRPKWFIAENVSGLKSAGNNDLQIILRELADAGYIITPHLYFAENYGVPQKRHRIIIVGIRSDLDVEFQVPDPSMFAGSDISARTALSDIPSTAPNNEIHRMSAIISERLAFIRPGENVWEAEHRMPPHLRIATKTRISQIYKKLHPDRPSYTITASGGGGTMGYHWDNRELTNRERARLQTFPDHFEFVGRYSSVRKQIGMAVPCRLSRIIVTAILNSFARIPYPSVSPNIPS